MEEQPGTRGRLKVGRSWPAAALVRGWGGGVEREGGWDLRSTVEAPCYARTRAGLDLERAAPQLRGWEVRAAASSADKAAPRPTARGAHTDLQQYGAEYRRSRKRAGQGRIHPAPRCSLEAAWRMVAAPAPPQSDGTPTQTSAIALRRGQTIAAPRARRTGGDRHPTGGSSGRDNVLGSQYPTRPRAIWWAGQVTERLGRPGGAEGPSGQGAGGRTETTGLAIPLTLDRSLIADQSDRRSTRQGPLYCRTTRSSCQRKGTTGVSSRLRLDLRGCARGRAGRLQRAAGVGGEGSGRVDRKAIASKHDAGEGWDQWLAANGGVDGIGGKREGR